MGRIKKRVSKSRRKRPINHGESGRTVHAYLMRASIKPRVKLAVGARSMGRYAFDRGGWERRPARPDRTQIFWGVSGRGVFMREGREFRLGPDETFVYLPEHAHDIRCVGQEFDYYWWTIDGPLAFQTIEALGLASPKVRKAGPPPVDLFERLATLIHDVSPVAERKASVVAYNLLVAASSSEVIVERPEISESPMVQKCLEILKTQYTDPSLSIEEIADSLGAHRVALTRRFRTEQGIPPVEYLRSLRMRRAFQLLQETDLSVAEIARQSGYSDANYFSRAIHNATGQCPSEFRRPR